MHGNVTRGAKLPILLVTLAVVVAADLASKRWALGALGDGRPIELLGGFVPLTLAFNRGAAFSISVGDASRWVFLALSIAALAALLPLYRATRADDRARLFSIALVLAGALGNLIDRVRWDRGVVDFIGPIDLGFTKWPIFNVADMAITVGALLLGVSLLRDRGMPPAAEAPKDGAADERVG